MHFVARLVRFVSSDWSIVDSRLIEQLSTVNRFLIDNRKPSSKANKSSSCSNPIDNSIGELITDTSR